MTLDIENKLECVRHRNGKVVARCPACAEGGGDTGGDHLVILDGGNGPFGCIAYAGPAGHEHRRRIAQLAGTGPTVSAKPYSVPRAPTRTARPLPPLHTPAQHHLDHIAKVRGWHTPDGMEVLVQRGQLFIGDVFDDGQTWSAWLVCDSTRANVQARKMDGTVWTGIGCKKPKSLPGTTTTRMIGPADIGTRKTVWICEGQPDFAAAPIVARLAGLDLDQIAFCCITGANENPAPLHPDDLRAFIGKTVVIAVHHDIEHGIGGRAAARWATQLYEAGAAQVRGFDFVGTGGKDLADYLCRLAKPITAEAAPLNLAAVETAPDSTQTALPPPSLTVTGLDFSGFTKPPATYDGTPWDPDETTTVLFNSSMAIVEVHRPDRNR